MMTRVWDACKRAYNKNFRILWWIECCLIGVDALVLGTGLLSPEAQTIVLAAGLLKAGWCYSTFWRL